ncbi:hypothetical protein FN846DRAFT_1002248 [Sphaerosporella brunnea]|uniref:Uncharacterized protein n=1 Tax=Sphaerosporella brunnea TaxID=1250544 RepID=A0A5J5F4K1_9PEZI|nr:hypothetical protein FN846DRAFT_1002248 [Sphaerosporella brunnea]
MADLLIKTTTTTTTQLSCYNHRNHHHHPPPPSPSPPRPRRTTIHHPALMPPPAKRPRHVGASRRRDQTSPSPDRQHVRQATPADKPVTLIYKDYPALCKQIGIGVNDKATMLQIRTRILEQCQALGVPLDQNYRSYPSDAMARLAEDVTTWWNTNYGSTERYLSLGVVDSIIHRLCLDKVRNSRARNKRKSGYGEIGNAYRDPSAYLKYPGRDRTGASAQDASPDENGDQGGQHGKPTVLSEMEVPRRDSVTPPGGIDDGLPARSASAMNDPSEISPTPSPPRPDRSPPAASVSAQQSDPDSSPGRSATPPSRPVRHDDPGDPGSVSNVEPSSAAIIEFAKASVPATPVVAPQSIHHEVPGQAPSSTGGFVTPSRPVRHDVPVDPGSVSNVEPAASATILEFAKVSVPPTQVVAPQSMDNEVLEEETSKLRVATPPAAAPPSPQLSQLMVYPPQPRPTPVAAAPSAPPASANSITLTMPYVPATVTIPRARSLIWVVSRLGRYFHHPDGGFTLGALLRAPQLRLKKITTEAMWQTIATDPQIAELTIIANVRENLPVGEDGIQAYVGFEEEIMVLPRRAPLWWIVSRVAEWYWRAGDGYSLAVLLVDYNLTPVELDCEESWVRIASDPKVRTIIVSVSQAGTGGGGED